MPRRSIFISHASADKQALEPLVRAFIHCGYKVFVDNPVHDNWRFHAAEIEEWVRANRFAQIRNAKDWLGELRTALSRCDVVLVCLSNQLSEIGPELMAELIIADREGKLVACALPGTDFDQVKARAGFVRIGAAQAIVVDPAAIWRAVHPLPEPASVRDRSVTDPDLHNFQHLLMEIAKEPKDRLDADMQAGGYVDPSSMGNVYDSALARAIHRAGRGQQRQHFKSALMQSGVQVRLVSGPENEHVVDFVKALQGERASGEGDALHGAYVVGPVYLPNGSRRDEVFSELAATIIDQLPERPEIDAGDLKALAAHLAARPSPLVCVSNCYESVALRGQWQQVRLWREFWSELDAAADGVLRVLALLLVDLDKAEPGWQIDRSAGFDFPIPPDPKRLNLRLFRDFMKFVGGGFLVLNRRPRAPFAVVSPVCPLSKQEIRAWIREERRELEGRDLEVADDILRANGEKRETSGVSMDEFRRTVLAHASFKASRATASAS